MGVYKFPNHVFTFKVRERRRDSTGRRYHVGRPLLQDSTLCRNFPSPGVEKD